MGKTLHEPTLIQILMESLRQFDIPDGFCSVGEYAEEAVCLEKADSSWIVYEGERGKKYNIKTHRNCREACCDIISRVAQSDDSEKEITDLFLQECEKIRFTRLGYQDSIVPIRGNEEFDKKASTAVH